MPLSRRKNTRNVTRTVRKKHINAGCFWNWFSSATPEKRIDPKKPVVTWSFYPVYMDSNEKQIQLKQKQQSKLWKKVFHNKNVQNTVLNYESCLLKSKSAVKVQVKKDKKDKIKSCVIVTVRYKRLSSKVELPTEHTIREHYKSCMNDWIEQDDLRKFSPSTADVRVQPLR